MDVSKAFVRYCSLFLSAALFALLVVCTFSVHPVLAEPVDAGEEPTGAPIVYNLTPTEGTIVAQDELNRAAATIETQRDAGLRRAGIFVDGRRRPSALMGPTKYLQTVSADIGNLEPGAHVVKVKAVDSEGRVGGYVWTFTVVESASR
jgi:hypothetical protein